MGGVLQSIWIMLGSWKLRISHNGQVLAYWDFKEALGPPYCSMTFKFGSLLADKFGKYTHFEPIKV